MTPSALTLPQSVLDFPIIGINSVISSTGNCPTGSPCRITASLKHVSGFIKSGFSHDLDANLEATLTEVVCKTNAPHLRKNQLSMQNKDSFPESFGHCSSGVSNSNVADNDNDGSPSPEDISVDVVSATSRDLSSLHSSLLLNAQGNYDLDEAFPVEPFVQELVQWKKVKRRVRTASSKRKRSPSVSRSKRRKTSPIDNSTMNRGDDVAVSNVLNCEVPRLKTLSSNKSLSSDPRNFCNTLSVHSNSLTSVGEDSKDIAVMPFNGVVESQSIANRGADGLLQPTKSTITPNSHSPISVFLCHSAAPQQQSASLSDAGVNDIISFSNRANEAEETLRGEETVSSPSMPDVDTVEVVDLENEDSDLDEGEELLLTDLGADLASAVQFVELRTDDVIGDQGESLENQESQTDKGQRSSRDDGVSDTVLRKVEYELSTSGWLAADNVTAGRGKDELGGSDTSTKNKPCLTASKDGCEETLLSLSCAASKKRVRKKRVIKYQANTLTSASHDGAEYKDFSEGNHLIANRGEESRVKWQNILYGNTFSERKESSNSEVSRSLSACSSEVTHSLHNTLLEHGPEHSKSPVGKGKVLPLEDCKTKSSNSVTHLIKRGKHWFKKVVPVPLEDSQCALKDVRINSGREVLLQSRSVPQTKPDDSRLSSSEKAVGSRHKGCRLIAPKASHQYPSPLSGRRFRTILSSPSPVSRTAGVPACVQDPASSGPTNCSAVVRPTHYSPSLKLSQDQPEVQFVAMEDVTDECDGSVLDEASHADDCDPLGGEAGDPLSFDQKSADHWQGYDYDQDAAVESIVSSQKRSNFVKSELSQNSFDSGLGNSLDLNSNPFNPGPHPIRTESVGERPSHYNFSASLDENHINETLDYSSSTLASFQSHTLPNVGLELPPPSGICVRHYNLTDDAVHFNQSKQMILDPKGVQNVQHVDKSRLPVVCDAEDFIMENFSSNNYVFCEVDPNTSRLPRGLHRFSLQVKGNRVYRSSKPCQTFRIEAAPGHDDPTSSTSARGTVPGNIETCDSSSGLPSAGPTDSTESSSFPRLSSSGSLVMHNPFADLKRYLLASDRLQELHAGLQHMLKTEKAARLAANCSGNGPPQDNAALQELYSKRVHIQVHFYKVLHYLKASWFREKLREAQFRATVSNPADAQEAP